MLISSACEVNRNAIEPAGEVLAIWEVIQPCLGGHRRPAKGDLSHVAYLTLDQRQEQYLLTAFLRVTANKKPGVKPNIQSRRI